MLVSDSLGFCSCLRLPLNSSCLPLPVSFYSFSLLPFLFFYFCLPPFYGSFLPLCVPPLRVSLCWLLLGSVSYLLALISTDPTGLTTSPARGRLHCYTCSFAKPCYPVPTECQDDEACGITVGTSGRSLVHWPLSRWIPTHFLPAFPAAPASAFLLHPTDQNEIIERKGCLPMAQCPLPGHATYWSRAYVLRHHCCEQDLCNSAVTAQWLPSLFLTTLFLLAASFAWGGQLFH